MPLEENQFRTVRGLLDLDPVYGVFLTPDTLALFTDHNDPDEYRWKRAYACLCSILMPVDGLDEHFEATIERFKYYKEMAALSPPLPKPEPVQFTAKFAGFTPRPEFVVSE